MDREDQRQPRRDPGERPEQRLQPLAPVDVRGPMQRDHAVALSIAALAWASPRAPSVQGGRRHPRQQVLQGIDHDVADEADPALGDPLAAEVGHGALLAREQQLGQVIDEHPVGFFRHRAIEAAQPRLDMRHRHLPRRRRERAGEAEIGVAEDHDEDRARGRQHRVQRLQHRAEPRAARAAADPEVDLGLGQLELAQQRRAELGIEMLPGMHDLQPDLRPQRADERRELDEIGSRTDDRGDQRRRPATGVLGFGNRQAQAPLPAARPRTARSVARLMSWRGYGLLTTSRKLLVVR